MMSNSEFTHLAEIYGVRCYYNMYSHEIKGTNLFNDLLISVFIWIEVHIGVNEWFNIKIIKEL